MTRQLIDLTPDILSVAVSVTLTGETIQPFAPAVEAGTALVTGGVPSTVNEPVLYAVALPHASLPRSAHE